MDHNKSTEKNEFRKSLVNEPKGLTAMSSSSIKVEEKFQLKRQLGVIYGVAIIMGLTVGGGIHISPQSVLKYAGSPGLTLIMWLLGGIYAFLGALVFAEIGIHIPIAGERYAYLSELYSPYFGYVFIWQYLLLVRPGSNALKLIIFGRYILKPMYQYCEVPRLPILLLASAMCLAISALNSLSVKVAARGQSLMTTITASTLVFIAVIGLYSLAIGQVENLQDPFKDSCTAAGCWILAFYATVFSYHGWSALNFLVEELRNPNRTLPLSIIVSSSSLTVLYVLVNLTYMVVLDRNEAINSEAIAISAVMKLSGVLGWIMSALIALTACSSCNSGILVGSRMAFAGARNGHLPAALSFINIKRTTPMIAVAFMGFVTLAYIWSFDVEFIMNNITFSGIISDFLVAVGYLWRRIKHPIKENDKKLKMPLAIHIIYSSCLLILTVVPLIINPERSASAFIITVLTSTTFYIIFVKLRLASRHTKDFTDKIYILTQKLFNSAPEEKDD